MAETAGTGGRVLVTGATGFIGRAMVTALSASGFAVRAAIRAPADLPQGVESAVVGDLRRPMNLAEAFHDIDFVVHSAGLTHVDHDISDQTQRDINAGITAALAAAARRSGVRRFVLLSSVRAQTGPVADGVVTESTPVEPTDVFGRSKLEGERALIAAEIPFVILRPVVVHGHGMRFNMAEMLQLARSRWPVPFGGIKARRSIVARGHLVEAVQLALASDEMTGETYLVADSDPVSPAEIVAALRAGWARRPGIISLPSLLVAATARWRGQADQLKRLRQSLVIDSAKLRGAGWRPVRSTLAALTETARSYG